MSEQSIGEQTYVSLTTTRRSGEPVPTPVWVVTLGDGALGVWTSGTSGKVKRIAHTPAVTLRPCDRRGTVAEGAPTWTGTAVVVRSGGRLEEVRGRIRSSYGVLGRVLTSLGRVRRHEAAVVITLDLDQAA